MNIITHFKQILEQNFNNFIKKYFGQSTYWNKSSNIGNYINFMIDLVCECYASAKTNKKKENYEQKIRLLI